MALSFTGCSSWAPVEKNQAAASETMPGSVLNIDGLVNCDEFSEKQFAFNDTQPLIVLVHGLRGSAQSFTRLSQQLRASGRQPICFTYDDRDSLVSSSAKLAESLRLLSFQTGRKEIAVLGHSLGALVARRALISEYWEDFQSTAIDFRLITVSGPFGGIDTASGCTSPVMRFLTLGLVVPLCKMVSGDKWYEITFRSDFIRNPGHLSRYVSTHLKIETDEEEGCLVFEEKICRVSDSVFSLDEQRHPEIDRNRRVRAVIMRAGHVGVLGNEHLPASQLLLVMEKNRMLPETGKRYANAEAPKLVQSQDNSSGSSGQAGY